MSVLYVRNSDGTFSPVSGAGGTVTNAQIEQAVEKYLAENPVSGGNSIYYMDFDVECPKPDSEISFNSVTLSTLSNKGAGIKIGDIIIASNGTLCKVTSVSTNDAGYEPIGNIGGSGNDSSGYVGITIDGETLVIEGNSTATIENETLIL